VLVKYCDSKNSDPVQSCVSIPTLISEEEAELLQSIGDPVTESLDVVTRANVIVMMLVGATASELFGAIRHFQFFTCVAMIEISYPGNLRFFYSILVNYSELDFF
jgi:hypothetical protein